MRPNALISLAVAATGIGIGLTHFEPPDVVGALLGQIGMTLLGHGLLAFRITLLVPLLVVAVIWQMIEAPARQVERVPECERDAGEEAGPGTMGRDVEPEAAHTRSDVRDLRTGADRPRGHLGGRKCHDPRQVRHRRLAGADDRQDQRRL